MQPKHTREKKCSELVFDKFRGRIEDLDNILNCRGDWAEYKDYNEALHSFGLCFDYVEPNTYNDQPKGYFRYQISWGGPSDEFRIYMNEEFNNIYNIEYWFLDWGDGAKETCTYNKINNEWGLQDFFMSHFIEISKVYLEKALQIRNS
jgi:hypothetical protein